MLRKLQDMSRKEQLWWLVGLSALTAVAQYVVQGALASGHNPAGFMQEFWYVDYALWGLRALIEAWAVVYLFATVARTIWQEVLLIVFEVALIALIALTLGPALRALGMGLQMRDSLSPEWFTAWSFGVAAYVSLMMAASGTAYKIQPDQAAQGEGETMQAQWETMQDEIARLRAETERTQADVAAERAVIKAAIQFLALSPQLQVRWVADHRNGDGPSNQELAERYGVNTSTVGRWIND